MNPKDFGVDFSKRIRNTEKVSFLKKKKDSGV